MAVTIYDIETTDSPNDGRLKTNTNFSNVKTAVDANTDARTGIGSVVGTTATQTITNKTLVSSNIGGGTNDITIDRLDIQGSIFRIDTDSGSKAVPVNGASITDIDILGENGIETRVTGGKIYIENSSAVVLDESGQTLTLGASAVTAGYAVDITGNQRLYGKLAIGDWSGVSAETVHLKGADNASSISLAIQNTGTAGAELKLMESSTASYWFTRYASGTGNELEIGYSATGVPRRAIIAKPTCADGSIYIDSSNRVGFGTTSPSYAIQVSTGIGISFNQIVMHPATSDRFYYAGANKTQFMSDGNLVMEWDGSLRTVGIRTNADANYGLLIDGSMKAIGSYHTDSGLNVAETSNLNGGISVNSGQFTVSSAGDTFTTGSLTVGGSTIMAGTLVVNNDVSMQSNRTLKVHNIRATSSQGVIIRNDANTAIAYFNDNGELHVGDALSSVDAMFAVKGNSRFVRETGGSTYIELSSDGSGNYIDTSDTGASQQPLYIRTAGTGAVAKNIHFQTGSSTSPGSLEDRMVLDAANKRVYINGTTGYDHLTVHSSVATQRSMSMHLGGSTYLTWNAGWDGSDWRYYTTNNAASMILTSSQFSMAMAASGTAGNVVTWNQGLRMNSSGKCSIGASPNNSYDLYINDALRAGNITCTGTTTLGAINGTTVTTTSTANGSITSNGGVYARGGIGTVLSTELGMYVQKRTGATYSATTPKFTFRSTAGSTIGQIQGNTDGDGKYRLEATGGGSDGYLYASDIKAGSALYASYEDQVNASHATPKWAPVPFTVYAASTVADNDLVSSGNKVITFRIPRAGLYRFSYTVQAYNNTIYDPQGFWVKGTVVKPGPTTVTVTSHRRHFDTYDGTQVKTLMHETVMGMASLTPDDNTTFTLAIDGTYSKNLTNYIIGNVIIEYVANEDDFNLYTP